MTLPAPPAEVSDENTDRASSLSSTETSAPPSSTRAAARTAEVVLHPRGRISPPLPSSESRSRHLVRGVLRLAQGLYHHHEDIFHAAPAMAFHFFLSLLPLLVFIGYVVGLVAQRNGASVVFGLLLQNVPPTAKVVLQQEVLRLAAADRLGPISALGFLWIASGGIQGLMQAIERVVGVPRRSWWKQRLLALGWVVGSLVAVAISSFGIIEWNEVVQLDDLVTAGPAATDGQAVRDVGLTGAAEQQGPASSRPRTSAESLRRPLRFLRSTGESLLAMALSLVAAVGGLAAFYRFAVAHNPRSRRRVLPGALVAMGLVIVISSGFSLYVRTLGSYTVYYGSLAAIAVLLIWLWLMSLAILVGAELNSQLEGLRDLDGEARA